MKQAANPITGGVCMTNHFGQQAVVIGGSLAGLMTARVLADHFDVTMNGWRPFRKGWLSWVMRSAASIRSMDKA
jgi:hypothetical protein